jgi:hypothetical protein
LLLLPLPSSFLLLLLLLLLLTPPLPALPAAVSLVVWESLC